MTRRKTDGERIAERMVKTLAIGREHVQTTARAIDRVIRKRRSEAWDDGYVEAWREVMDLHRRGKWPESDGSQ